MLRQGLITEIFPDKGLCRVKFLDDDFVTKPIQICFPGTMANKWHVPFAINELVGVLMDEYNEDGFVLGALYNTTDLPAGATDHNVRVTFKDGAYIDYDFTAKKLTISTTGNVQIVCDDAEVDASGDVLVQCHDSTITASHQVVVNATDKAIFNTDVVVNGKISATGDIHTDANATATGNVAATGNVSATGNVAAGGNVAATGGLSGGGITAAGGTLSAQNVAAQNNIVAAGDVQAGLIGGISLKNHVHTGVQTGGGSTGPAV